MTSEKPIWAEVRGRATELLGQDATPGRDYFSTEVVHCKSVKEKQGVRKAAKFCADQYLKRVMAVSGARVVVCVGKIAREQVGRAFKLPDDGQRLGHPDPQRVHGPLDRGNRQRYFVFLPHPSAFEPRPFAKCVLESDMERLRDALRA
jgi:uracil-DNA glycosylase